MRKQDLFTFGFIALLSFFLLSPGHKVSPDTVSLENEEVAIKSSTEKTLGPVISSVGPSTTVAATQTLTTKYLNFIPTEDQINKADLHHTPDAIIEGGEIVGRVVEQIKDNPKLVKEGLDFFEKCTQKADLPIAVRAVCFRRLKDWSVKTKTPLTLTDSKVPEFIAQIANELASDFE